MFFFFKQKTAYKMRISYWSSDVCSSDLMNSLITIGTVAAFGYSLLVTLAPGVLPSELRDGYYEAVGVIITLIPLGRLLEARAKATSEERRVGEEFGITCSSRCTPNH